MKLVMPVMIFTNTVDGVDRSSLLGSLSLLGLTALLYACTFVMARLMAAAFRLQGDRALTMFGNVGFMGIPIVSSIFPDYGMLYIAVFTIIDQMVLWTLGVKLTTPGGKGSFDPKKMINPLHGGHRAVGGDGPHRAETAVAAQHRPGQNRRHRHPAGHDLSGRCLRLHEGGAVSAHPGILRHRGH